jgi:hypothetical protein
MLTAAWAGLSKPRPEQTPPGRIISKLGRNRAAQAGIWPHGLALRSSDPGWPGSLHPGWALLACPGGPFSWPSPPRGPASRQPAGPTSAFPGWAGFLHPGWARKASLAPRLPGHPGAPMGRLLATRLGRIRRIRPGRESSAGHLHSVPRLGRNSSTRLGRLSPSRPLSFNPGWAGLTAPAGPPPIYYSGWARTVLPWPRPGYPPCRPNYSPPGPGFTSPGYILRPASALASCASPGTPLGSDWHLLHRHMLVLGRPLAQTSISLLS